MDKFIRKIYTPNVEVLLFPSLVIIITLFLSIFVFKNGYIKIKEEFKKLETTQASENLLIEKLTILSRIPSGVLDKTNVVLVTLPEQNPAVFSISQLRNASQKTQVQLNSFGVEGGGSIGNNISTLEIGSNQTVSNHRNAITFLNYFKSVSPLARVDSASFSESFSGNLELNTKISIFYSSLPTTLPPITAPIKELTKDQEELLRKVANLFLPEFSVINPSQPVNRENPFK